MARAMMFSRVFPDFHPRKGEPTEFIEKIWKGIYQDSSEIPFPDALAGLWDNYYQVEAGITPKLTTIRRGEYWAAGQTFSPRVWAGTPRRSPHVIIGPNLTIEQTWPVLIWLDNGKLCLDIRDWFLLEPAVVAANDGLTEKDFTHWFTLNPEFREEGIFRGQIITWSKEVNYGNPVPE